MGHFLLGVASIQGLEHLVQVLFYFVITIFVLVTIHEFGHFIAGRIFGMHVPVFSVGMGRRILGFNKLNGFTFGPLDPETEIKLGANTDYRLSLLPIGGYAKIDGMIDETQTEALPTEMQPWEFRAKPWWQKSIVITAGVIMNVLLAWFIFSARDYSQGIDLHTTTTVGYVEMNSVSHKLGVQAGDKIVAINNAPVDNWEDIRKAAIIDNIGKDFAVTFDRSGQRYTVTYRSRQMGSAGKTSDREDAFGLTPTGFGPPTIESVVSSLPADHAGLKPGDVITRVGGDSIVDIVALTDHVHQSLNKPLAITFLRNGKLMSATVVPTMGASSEGEAQAQIGVSLISSDYHGPRKHIDYSLTEAPGVGWSDLVENVVLTGKMLGLVITGQLPANKALGGPIKIAQLASQSAASGFDSFMVFVGLLSMSLAMLNILPVPALDGGHLLIILIEAAIGRELSQKFKLNFQKVGVALLLFLMVFMVINDIRGL